ncbi:MULTISPECIES: tyrosinase family oxidase copper chaperone [unclassified Streptomyces]|uniref:tyrosinase family oxidase copper chaperone n=1 Tax=unclassified Streptomyces TaxID=2593676 RepID=UPI002E12518A|nr:tyrosinase cofactor [Streptomyces sp. NBC_01197]WSS50609.1 tyrosinase cofactor [Streptomyces sp. NBC_01180]
MRTSTRGTAGRERWGGRVQPGQAGPADPTERPGPVNRPGPELLSRRGALRALFAVGAVGGTAVALAPIVRSAAPDREGDDGKGNPSPRPPQEPRDVFDEVYRGRRIRGGTVGHETEVTVDGRPLHLMRRADGSYLSMVDHYESYPTPLEAARAAVDELGAAQLSLTSIPQL